MRPYDQLLKVKKEVDITSLLLIMIGLVAIDFCIWASLTRGLILATRPLVI